MFGLDVLYFVPDLPPFSRENGRSRLSWSFYGILTHFPRFRFVCSGTRLDRFCVQRNVTTKVSSFPVSFFWVVPWCHTFESTRFVHVRTQKPPPTTMFLLGLLSLAESSTRGKMERVYVIAIGAAVVGEYKDVHSDVGEVSHEICCVVLCLLHSICSGCYDVSSKGKRPPPCLKRLER